ncbi:unnamed protein product [Rotaria socialis]|uniref:Uncharacterized protein n=2 Tax=Rotaria socialis TaxID=392032 RepID=A0A817U210_9BILA|nr:unnamed protein product [Rotaria socialis]
MLKSGKSILRGGPLRKNCNSIYDIPKDILCGKQLNSLVDSLQSRIRLSFTCFVSYILKHIVDDYGLESLVQVSSKHNNCNQLLDLIDYSSFIVNYENENTLIMKRMLTLNDHYSCVLQTPLFYLCGQCIKNLSDDIKLKLAQQLNEKENNRRFDYYDVPATTFDNWFDNEDNKDRTQEQHRNRLIQSLMNDAALPHIISSSILQSYINDSIRVLCKIIGNHFHEDEKVSFNSSSNRDIWQLAHIYTLFEYEEKDILSFYSACRITENFDRNQSFYNDLLAEEDMTRLQVRENLFRLMFHHLWTKLCEICQTNENAKQWIHCFTLISKYYPSESVLKRMEFVHMKIKIEFMNLAYLILVNEKTPEPIQLFQQLLNETSLMQDDINDYHANLEGSANGKFFQPKPRLLAVYQLRLSAIIMNCKSQTVY